AVVGLGVVAADAPDAAAFARILAAGDARARGAVDDVGFDLRQVRFPPDDLKRALPQQLLVLKAAEEAVRAASPLPRDRTAVFVGMGCDTEIARYGLRMRLADWDPPGSPGWCAAAEARANDPLVAANVVGALPNVVANRINASIDAAGPGFTVSAEQASGLVALRLAARALAARECDVAVVAAVDVCCETVHAEAARAVLDEALSSPGDAAVALVLKRPDDAHRDGDDVLGLLQCDAGGGEPDPLPPLAPLFGHAHAASGLLAAAAAVVACRHGIDVAGGPAGPRLAPLSARAVEAVVPVLGAPPQSVRARAADAPAPAPLLLTPPPRLHVYAGETVASALRSARQGIATAAGPARLVVVATTEDELSARRARAVNLVEAGSGLPPSEGAHLREHPLAGDVAFVFPGAAAAYAGMGRTLALAFPDVLARMRARVPGLERIAGWVYDAARTAPPTAAEKLWGSSYLCQLHAILAREVLGIRAHAAIGVSSGETNALFAMGAWDDIAAFHDRLGRARLFEESLGGSHRVLAGQGKPRAWSAWRVLASDAELADLLAAEPALRHTVTNAPGDVVIGGAPDVCRRAVARLGEARARPLDYDFVAHCEEVAPFADEWRRLHTWPTRPVEGVRFYGHATGGAYSPTAASAADALTAQALRHIDFPALVESAWDDGVRVFIELGPQGGCSHAIRAILGTRAHVAVSFDIRAGCGVRQLAHALAPLIAAGVPVPGCDVLDRLADGWRDPPRHDATTLRVPAHRPPIEWPPIEWPPVEAVSAAELAYPAAQFMPPPPSLPPGLAEAALEVAAVGAADVVAPDAAALRAHLERLTSAHRAYLEQASGAAQRRFLDISRRAFEAFLGAGPSVALANPVPPPAAPHPLPTPRTLDRRALEAHASGAIADAFGPTFAPLAAYRRVVRMPEPPLLLADRAVSLEGEPATLGLGRVRTETDICADSWYLHDNRMPAGIMIEAGQADLLLISWLGIDFENRGERVYRLLGCDLTYHGSLPQAGDTLHYDIRIDAHARQGDVRLFFFHYDCTIAGVPKLTVRNGQAGFFSDDELARSGGVLWDADSATPTPSPRLDPPVVDAPPRAFDAEAVRAFADRRPWDCFGPAFAVAATHQRPPAIPGGRMLLFDRVDAFDPTGGPWRRGYLRAVRAVAPDDWFFAGHFKDDPCMPGTLMFEGSLQAMAFYMAAMGVTLSRDSWRFEPVPEEAFRLICRGQAVPTTRELVIEIFVDEFVVGPTPTLYADLLGTVDGLKAFYCRRMALRLVPDWPLSHRPEALAAHAPARPVASAGGIDFDYPAMLACAWGPPTAAFGAAYARYDGGMRPPRLPGPPYHFLTRATRIDGALGVRRLGTRVEVEYDVPADAWYFAENGAAVMPFCVLLEAALQPCGWLASFVGVPLESDGELFFRNLDGTATLHAPIPRGARLLTQSVTLTGFSRAGGVALTAFDVESRLDGAPVFTMRTSFGYFTAEALANQVGLPTGDDDRARFALPQNADIDLRSPGAACAPPMAHGSLLMLDRITGLWPSGGPAGKGAIRAETRISPHDWYFKAHFFQDPVQPGSLGLEAMIQLLQALMRSQGFADGFDRPCFEPVMIGEAVTWKYRGQILPTRRLMTTEVWITASGRDAAGLYAIAEALLWIDGIKIFHMPRFGMRIVERPAAAVSAPG
ncbi:MAG: beta-ketoacyl synthase N-terminal-like domain-containing protein, partial [Rhodospirillaceae bacterium]